MKTIIHSQLQARVFLVYGECCPVRARCDCISEICPKMTVETKINCLCQKNLNIEVKDEMNFYFCDRMTEYYDNEEKKLRDMI